MGLKSKRNKKFQKENMYNKTSLHCFQLKRAQHFPCIKGLLDAELILYFTALLWVSMFEIFGLNIFHSDMPAWQN